MPNPTYNDSLYDFSSNILATQSILDVFVLQDILDSEDADRLRKKFRSNREIENFLIKNRIVTKDTINKAYSIMLKLPYVELKNTEIPQVLRTMIDEKMVVKYGIIPFSLEDGLIRIALSRPSDLLFNYQAGLKKIFQEKNLEVELFITGDSDYNEIIKQYRGKAKDQFLIKKGAFPVVYLRNQFIPSTFYKKLPKEFVVKYRIAVFGQNKKGYYLIACEQPDSPLTLRILDFLQKENNIKLEKFATSVDDIDSVLEIWDKGDIPSNLDEVSVQKIPVNKTATPETKPEEKKEAERDSAESKGGISNLLDSLFETNQPEITMDEIPSTGFNLSQDSPQKNSSGSTVKVENEPKPESGVRLGEEDELPPKEENPKENKDDNAIEDVKVIDRPMTENTASGNIGNLIQAEITTVDQLEEIVKEGYIPKIVAGVINFALNKRSSDIHVEPESKVLRIRCRIDGVLQDVLKIPMKFHPPFISRVKILSKLKIDEARMPQDGRFDVAFKNREVDVRVSTLPTIHGEKVVMRILDKSQNALSLEDLGMQGSAFEESIKAMARPFGIILSCGPTGSGKSTTLYAMINRLSKPSVNIITLEDPVEYDIPGVNQCQIKPEIGFTFASGLRSILRQDPNIIMVGEVRDAETAGMATHAALTGHLVLSTLHTNDTAGALPRLINMGIEPYLITSSINLVIAQRLVRRICPKCKEEMKVPQKLMDELKAEMEKISPKNTKDRERIPAELRLYYGKGCDQCSHGYLGRIGIFEVMDISTQIEELAVAKRPANEIKEAALANGMITMKQDGIIKAFLGLTTVDEVFQAVINN